jgi:Cys-rich repeat protein
MNAHVKAVTIWSTLCGSCVLAAFIALTGQTAETQTAGPVPPAERVSIRDDGGQANGNSNGAAISGDASCVAFYSDATNLDADTNGHRDVFVFDRETSSLQRVSVASDGAQANGPSQSQGFRPAVDETCSCVAFSSDATNLVDDDTNGVSDVFVRDLAAGVTERVSMGDAGEANGASSFPSVSGDCQLVAFQSTASNLVPDDTNDASDVFLYNRATGAISRVSTGSGGVQANGASLTPAISADGRCVAFASAATNLVPGDTNGTYDVYVVCDGQVTCRASVDSSGNEANDMSLLPALSSDGTIVAFKSNASNLVPGDFNASPDVFVHDCVTGETERVSVNSLGQEGNDISIPPSISGDGRFVAFGSFANLLIGRSTRGRAQVYVRDRNFATTLLISESPDGVPGNASVPDVPPSVSLDGTFVAFDSLASNLVPGDTNQVIDAFAREVVTVVPQATPTPTGTRAPTATPRIPCNQDQDCPTGQVCGPDGLCEPAPTPTPTIPCNTNEDCPDGLVCVDGICVDLSTPTPTPTPLPTCVVDEDCPEGQHCRAMVCVPVRECDDTDPEVDRFQCRGVREACVGNTCECGGDCNLNGIVFGTEITNMVCILGGDCDLSECEAGDVNGDGVVSGSDVSLAVLNLGLGCPGEGTPLLFGESRADEVRTITLGSEDLEGAPGQFVDVDITISGGGDVTTAQTDIVFDKSLLTVMDPVTGGPDCQIAPRLADQFFPEIRLPQTPRVPDGFQRLRVAVVDTEPPLDTFGDGLLATCRFRIQPTAPVGSMADLTPDTLRLEIGDPNHMPFDAMVNAGRITVVAPPPCMEDMDCPEGTQCRGGVCVPIVTCMQQSDCSSRQACIDGRCECGGDCNLDGEVFVNEVATTIAIFGELQPVSVCPAADINGDEEVFANEVSTVIANFGLGCPGVQ